MTQPSENGLDAARPIPAPFDAETVAAWIAGDPDPGAREELSRLLAAHGAGDAAAAAELADAFVGLLRFGTAGLRR